MRLRDALRSALQSLRGNRMRTALTALGTIIGVASVVVVLAIGEGAQASVTDRVRALGTNLLTVRPGVGGFGPVRSGNVETLTLADATALARVPGVVAVSPESTSSAQIRFLGENTSSSVVGVTAPYFSVRNLEIASGLGISTVDEATRARVAVLGANISDDLFGSASPLGERIQIRGIAFRVVGVLGQMGEGFGSPDDQVLVPLSVHTGTLFGQDYLSQISVELAEEDQADTTIDRISSVLRLRHALRDDEDDDFNVSSQAEMLRTMSAITGTLTALLSAVALVSLVVGGIGIMNIMLASVTERTREIGVRMAVGARRRDVLLQFLLESVLVSMAGGVAGLLLGVLAALAIARIGGWTTIVPASGVALALGVSALVGIVFGVGPARRAASLDPVEALRQE
ncbi:MAG: ABC transporter permease [Deltaproteobacteria bacterium]|nr:ABC transporter permease [Deltaproteobacteria bacterium]